MSFKEMNLKELWQFWIKDWKQEAPTLENTLTMRKWEDAINKAIERSSVLELIESLHITDTEIDYLEQVTYMRRAVFDYFCDSLQGQVNQIETSVKLLLKEHENEQADITIGQLNRLKNGI